MGTIDTDAGTFDVDHIGRERYTPSYVLRIRVEDRNAFDYPDHELEVVLNVGRRSDVTDDRLADELDKWANRHPDVDIAAFGVVEELSVREADPIDTDDPNAP